MWQYQNTDNMYIGIFQDNNELYHYGVLGMKWGHRKSYGSLGANLAARIRNSQLKSTKSRISGDSKAVKKMNKDYEWMKKNQADIKKSGSKIGNSKILTSIRKARMNKLKKKINTTNASIKEDHQIVKELNKYEAYARKRAQNISRTKAAMQKAKLAKKSANKQYSKDFDKAYAYSSRHMISQYGKGKHGQESTARWKKADNSAVSARNADVKYKKAKEAYKSAKR